jgi:phospholipase D1/2
MGDVGSNAATKVLGKMQPVSTTAPKTAGDDSLDEERKTFTRDGKKEPGFASAIVPTLEEKTVAEHRPPKSQIDDAPDGDEPQDNNTQAKSEDRAPETSAQNGGTKANDDPPQPRVEGGELFGAPADASKSPETDDQPPHARSGIDDANEEEQAAPGVRSTLRKHLASKFGSKTWTLPTPKPRVDPQAFEDPISDAFWKNVWVASASHNVCADIVICCCRC